MWAAPWFKNPPPKKKKKMPSRMYMLGVCRKVTPYANVMKLGTVGLIGYVIALTAVGPHRLTGFGVTRHPSWVPAIDKAHRAYYSCSRYRGNAWCRCKQLLTLVLLAEQDRPPANRADHRLRGSCVRHHGIIQNVAHRLATRRSPGDRTSLYKSKYIPCSRFLMKLAGHSMLVRQYFW